MLLPIISLLVSGCATVSSDEVATCPALKDYSFQEQEQSDAELGILYKALGGKGIVESMMDDYGDLRAQVRACQKAAK